MIRKILIAVLLIAFAGYALIKLFTNTTHMDWGHHFNFDNRLGIEIDSLEIAVGDVKTVIHADFGSIGTLEGNIDVPKNAYPHKVILKLFTAKKTMILNADSFNCYNCDGYHQYTLKETGAEYKFLN